MPKQYVQYIDEYIENTQDDCLYLPDAEFGIQIEEGVQVVSKS